MITRPRLYIYIYQKKKGKLQTSRTLGTESISEKAKREGCDVASTITEASADPFWFDACFTKYSMCSACLCSISIFQFQFQCNNTKRGKKELYFLPIAKEFDDWKFRVFLVVIESRINTRVWIQLKEYRKFATSERSWFLASWSLPVITQLSYGSI